MEPTNELRIQFDKKKRKKERNGLHKKGMLPISNRIETTKRKRKTIQNQKRQSKQSEPRRDWATRLLLFPRPLTRLVARNEPANFLLVRGGPCGHFLLVFACFA